MNLLQKNVIALFFGEPNFKMALICFKGAIFDLLFTFFSHQGKLQKFLQHDDLTPLHTHILLTLLIFLALRNFEKKYEFIRYGFCLIMCPGVDSYSRHFVINK